jgi:hypothetical protein
MPFPHIALSTGNTYKPVSLHMNFRIIFLLSILFICLENTYAQVMIDNDLPRRDVQGKIVDAHDGRIIQFGNRYYWYGTKYGSTNGFTTANEYVCYSSPDLKQWKLEGALLPQKPEGVYYRPHVVFNKKTGTYILWYNWYPKLWNGQFGVATASQPQGPFTILNNNVSVKHSALGVGDLGVFVDEDAKAYLSYNTINGHKVSVELLNDDYTGSTLQGSDFLADNCEAGSMFKRNGLYYLLTDYTCCFCTQGSGAQVFTARNPLGPYTWRQNINRYAGTPLPLLHDGRRNDNFAESFDAKKKEGIQLQLQQPAKISAIMLYQFTGNRNGQCGEVEKPAVHEPILKYEFTLEYFSNGEWMPLPVVKSTITQQAQHNVYQLVSKAVMAEQIRIHPKYTDTIQPLQVSEISISGAGEFSAYKTGTWGKPIIPAQQTYVMALHDAKETRYIWMGDLWGSASDNIKGHDYQFWSAPLQFYSNGLIRQLEWTPQWRLK